MELYLLRHGEAVARGTPGLKSDAQRPLTPRGKQQIQRVSRAIAALGLDFDLILTSPWPRARESARLIAARLRAARRLKACAALAGDRSATTFPRRLTRLRPLPQKLLLVGHEPFLSDLISRLLIGRPGLSLDFPKAGLCKLKWECEMATHPGRKRGIKPGHQPEPKPARLAWLLTPRQLKKIR